MSPMRIRWSLISLALVGVLLLGSWVIANKPISAQGSGWSKPVMLSTNTISSWFPAIIVDHQGRVHVFYSSSFPPEDKKRVSIDLLMHTMWDGERWLEPRDILNPGDGGYVTRPRVVLDRAGNFHLLCRHPLLIHYTWSPVETAHRPQSWAPLRLLSSHDGAYYSDIAIDSHGALHVIWNEVTQDARGEESWICPDCADIYYRHSTDGGRTWSAPVNISRSPGGSTKCQIMVDAHDIIHVVWEEGVDLTGRGRPQGIAYRRSTDGGITWEPVYHVINGTLFAPGSTPQAIPTGQPTSTPTPTPLPPHRQWFSPTMFLDEPGVPLQVDLAVNAIGGTTLMAWRTVPGDHLYYQVSRDEGATWSQPAIIPGIWSRPANETGWDIYDMATDSAGYVHLVAVGRLQIRPSTGAETPISALDGLYHLTWDGNAWSAPEQIYLERGSFPEWPQIAVSMGNQLHVVWFIRGIEDQFRSEEGKYTVWYASRPVEAPAITPLPLFTPTPTATITATPSPFPTNTPLPTLPPDSSGLPNSAALYSETDDLLRLLVALSPVFLLIVLLFVVKKVWRR